MRSQLVERKRWLRLARACDQSTVRWWTLSCIAFELADDVTVDVESTSGETREDETVGRDTVERTLSDRAGMKAALQAARAG